MHRRGIRSLVAVSAIAVAVAGLGGCASSEVEAPGKALMDQAHRVANEALVSAAKTGLQALQAGGAVTEDAVRSALEKAGAVDVQTRDLGDTVLFGAGVSGGCVYGSIPDDGALSVELGAADADGGCPPRP
ncbi:hypothetical protein [Microbacterium sp. E-13]|uniref:hypothetical protein n=1 Tax=Microbacterium sp. E-13 TaxID=3404048 RepID=UPI003CF69B7F